MSRDNNPKNFLFPPNMQGNKDAGYAAKEVLWDVLTLRKLLAAHDWRFAVYVAYKKWNKTVAIDQLEILASAMELAVEVKGWLDGSVIFCGCHRHILWLKDGVTRPHVFGPNRWRCHACEKTNDPPIISGTFRSSPGQARTAQLLLETMNDFLADKRIVDAGGHSWRPVLDAGADSKPPTFGKGDDGRAGGQLVLGGGDGGTGGRPVLGAGGGGGVSKPPIAGGRGDGRAGGLPVLGVGAGGGVGEPPTIGGRGDGRAGGLPVLGAGARGGTGGRPVHDAGGGGEAGKPSTVGDVEDCRTGGRPVLGDGGSGGSEGEAGERLELGGGVLWVMSQVLRILRAHDWKVAIEIAVSLWDSATAMDQLQRLDDAITEATEVGML
jgi:hypothetical protein